MDEINSLLNEIYSDHSEETIEYVMSQIMQILKQDSLSERKASNSAHLKWDEHTAILISYPDSIHREKRPSLETLSELVDNKLLGIANVLHVLPFLCSSSDGGFAVSSYEEIEQRFGGWADLSALSKNYVLMADLVLNHVSSSHSWVQQFINRSNPGIKLILSPKVIEEGWEKVVRPRNSSLFTELATKEGLINVWTTFGPDQIDLNWKEPSVLIEFLLLIIRYFKHGIKWIRLDAVGFIWKETGTSCLHRKEVHMIVKILRIILSELSTSSVLITETNVPERENLSYLDLGDEANLVYNFTLPPLLLEAIISNKCDLLNDWLSIEHSFPDGTSLLNFTASHDGIGLRALEGLIDEIRFHQLLVGCEKRGGLISHMSSEDGVDKPYELNISWWSAMKDNGHDSSFLQFERFILSQLFTMALKGIPAFYLQSILASENDIKTFSKTGQRRDLNRQKFEANSLNLILEDCNSNASRIISYLKFAMNIRGQLKAFHPESPMSCLTKNRRDIVILKRGEGLSSVYAINNMTSSTLTISISDFITSSSKSEFIDTIDYLSNSYIFDNYLELPPYGVKWLGQKSLLR